MKYTFYIFGLLVLMFTSCRHQNEDQGSKVDPISIIAKATELAGGIENWSSKIEVKFGVSKVIYSGDKPYEKNEIHIYEFGDRSKKRISFEEEDGALKTYAELSGQYFSFTNELEDTLKNSAFIAKEMNAAYHYSCVPFSISEIEGQMVYMGVDSMTHTELSELVAINGDSEKWWFYFSKESGLLLSYIHLANGVKIEHVIKARQNFNGFTLPVYIKRYNLLKKQKRLLENVYVGDRTFK